MSVVPAVNKNSRMAAVQAEKYLPKNYSQKGDKNYTEYIQQAVDNNDVVVMPNFPVLVDWRGINLRSNTTIIFQKKSALKMMPNNKTNYHVLGIVDKENIKIYSPRISGDRKGHTDIKGEWGHGIKIFGSKAIRIYNPVIENCWGDGIYIGRGKIAFCDDIEIKGGKLDFNRRNGISVISARNLRISDVTISNTYGTPPMSGIDLEPNREDEDLVNIHLNNIKTINNGYDGIKIVLLSLNKKEVSINIDGHIDEESLYTPFTVYGYNKPDVDAWQLSGRINYINSSWRGDNYNKLWAESGGFNKHLEIYFHNNYLKKNGKSQKLKRDDFNIRKINAKTDN